MRTAPPIASRQQSSDLKPLDARFRGHDDFEFQNESLPNPGISECVGMYKIYTIALLNNGPLFLTLLKINGGFTSLQWSLCFSRVASILLFYT
jgi:hypothetical protein